MYNLKKTLFLNLTPRQKSALLSHLQALVQKNIKKNQEINKHIDKYQILNIFLEEEKYYHKIEQTHFHFVIENLENEGFINDILKFIDSVFYHLNFQERQKPYLDKQKELAKQQRKRAQEFKMSKLSPTIKQLKYYQKLTKSHNLTPKNTENASRLDLKNWIIEIIDNNKNEVFSE